MDKNRAASATDQNKERVKEVIGETGRPRETVQSLAGSIKSLPLAQQQFGEMREPRGQRSSGT
jgi:hypothetical protein